jgi:hypothetical protein
MWAKKCSKAFILQTMVLIIKNLSLTTGELKAAISLKLINNTSYCSRLFPNKIIFIVAVTEPAGLSRFT